MKEQVTECDIKAYRRKQVRDCSLKHYLSIKDYSLILSNTNRISSIRSHGPFIIHHLLQKTIVTYIIITMLQQHVNGNTYNIRRDFV